MKKTVHLTIPKPCNENWDSMTPNQKGRHCNVCNKTITDFTNASDRQIATTLLNNSNICGKFNKHQLNRDLILPSTPKKGWFPYIAATLVTSLLSVWKINAQQPTTVKTEQIDTTTNGLALGKVARTTYILPSKLITGTIYDNNGLPLPGTTVQIKGTPKDTTTDFYGKFSMIASENDTLVINYIGFKTQEIKIGKLTNFNINLEPDASDEIFLLGYVTSKKTTRKNSIKPKTINQRKNRSWFIRLFRK